MTGSVKVVTGGIAGGGIGSGTRVDEEIIGTVNGDVLRARSTNGRVQVELTVAGSEMAGPGSAYGTPGRFFLRQPDAVPSSR